MRENFSENLKEARLNANMTQAEVAKAVGVAKNTYCNLSGSKSPCQSGDVHLVPDKKNNPRHRLLS